MASLVVLLPIASMEKRGNVSWFIYEAGSLCSCIIGAYCGINLVPVVQPQSTCFEPPSLLTLDSLIQDYVNEVS
jgi:hypothetical protein